MRIVWGDDLKALADRLFEDWDAEGAGADPMRPKCLVVNSRVMEGWLRHWFVFDRRGRGRQRVLANWRVQFLNAFVNDWLYRMDPGAAEKRDPAAHPYSMGCLQWRIYRMLGDVGKQGEVFGPLAAYLGEQASDQRRFALAGALAKLFDDGQVYRPDMLLDWEKGVDGDAPAWQPALWRLLIKENKDSYLRQFEEMKQGGLARCGIDDDYVSVRVFGVPAMPPVYLKFFERLSEHAPVTLYQFAPARALLPRPKVGRGAAGRARGEGAGGLANPLLQGLGRAALEYAHAAGSVAKAEWTGKDSGADTALTTVLSALQQDIRLDRWIKGPGEKRDKLPVSADDTSLQIQICHSPLREVEVLHDHILRWFAENTERQPRDIQVQLTDMAVYAPYIDAVFGTTDKASKRAIPYVVADRYVAGTSVTARAFLSLLSIPGSRFQASRIMDLLDCEAARSAFGLGEDETARLREWVLESGIRWGLDADHRKALTGAEPFAATTWRRGLDRMLFGFAMGHDNEEQPLPAGELGAILPFDGIEGAEAALLGKLAAFVDSLAETAEDLAKPRTLTEWQERLTRLIDTFFRPTNETHRDIAIVRGAVEQLSRTGEAAGEAEDVSLDVVANSIEGDLETAEASDKMTGNAVVFSALRAGSSAPRRIMCVLGLSEGVFPHADRPPRYSPLARERRPCDPSRKLSDRQAFLEAIVCAGERLYLSYAGRSVRENAVIPPSTVLSELRDCLAAGFRLPPPPDSREDKSLLWCETLHRLQAFHPDYFATSSELFSYSRSNASAARQQAAGRTAEAPPPPTASAPSDSRRIPLTVLANFWRNPAKHYYTSTLKVRLDTQDIPVMQDTELFDSPEGLEEYKVNDCILCALLRDAPPDGVREALIERGMLPLGAPGKERFEEIWTEVKEFLEEEAQVRGKPQKMGDLLRREREREKEIIPLDVQVGGWRIEGHVDVIRLDGEPVALAFRYSGVKPKDEVVNWVQHLVCTAAGHKVATVVCGKNSKESAEFEPKAEREALKQLGELLDLVSEGQAAPLPFAPKTSKTFWDAYSGNAGEETAALVLKEAALKEARESWVVSDEKYSFGKDSSDPYLFRAFGDDGPMAPQYLERFIRIAQAVIGGMEGYRSGGATKGEKGGKGKP